jgi:hypothetical protein
VAAVANPRSAILFVALVALAAAIGAKFAVIVRAAGMLVVGFRRISPIFKGQGERFERVVARVAWRRGFVGAVEEGEIFTELRVGERGH